jgi:S1-C subfamily serine protease
MKQAWVLLVATTLLVTAAMGQAPRAGDADAGKSMADLLAKAKNTLAIVEFTLDDEMTDKPLPQPVAGMGICVNAGGADKKATLITTVLGSSVLPKNVKSAQVYLPGVEKPLKASYLATDPGSGFTFVRVEEPSDWQAVQFAEKAGLTTGMQVFSVGLLDQWLGFEQYLGMAYVSAQLHVPGPLVYATGGNLTNIGSPVFNAQGVGIGIVLQQLPNAVTLTGAQGQGGNVLLSAQRETSCFVPVDDFAYVLKNPPQPGKHPSWTGILRFDPYPQSVLALPTPAVKVGKVIPGSPAAVAGVKEGDTITQINGQNLEKLPTMELVRQNVERLMSRIPVGTEFSLTIYGQPAPVKIKTAEFPPTPREAAKWFCEPLGFVVREKVALDEALDPSPVTGKEKGLYVVGVVKGSPAEKAGLKGGGDYMLVVSASTKPVTAVADFKTIVEGELAAKKPINLIVHQGSRSDAVTITP